MVSQGTGFLTAVQALVQEHGKPMASKDHFKSLIQQLVMAHDREVAAARSSREDKFSRQTTPLSPTFGHGPFSRQATPQTPNAQGFVRQLTGQSVASAKSQSQDQAGQLSLNLSPCAPSSSSTGQYRSRQKAGGLSLVSKDVEQPYRIRSEDVSESRAEGSVERQKRRRSPWAEKSSCPLWRLGSGICRAKGGEEHIGYENAFARIRIENDAINKEAAHVKGTMKANKAEMLNLLEKLRQMDGFSSEVETPLRERLMDILSELEAADLKLATLRRSEIENIEVSRGARVRIWCIIHEDNVHGKLEGIENIMRSGRDTWWTSKKCQSLDTLEEELRNDKATFDSEANEIQGRQESLMKEVRELETRLAGLPAQDAWLVDSDEQQMYMRLIQLTREIDTLTWKRSRIRDQQLALLRDLYRLRCVRAILRRQAESDNVMKAGSDIRMLSQTTKLNNFLKTVQESISACEEHIEGVLAAATDAQASLREHGDMLNKESEAARDQLLSLISEVELEDERVAWLRKTQLQALELIGLLKQAAVTAPKVDINFKEIEFGIGQNYVKTSPGTAYYVIEKNGPHTMSSLADARPVGNLETEDVRLHTTSAVVVEEGEPKCAACSAHGCLQS